METGVLAAVPGAPVLHERFGRLRRAGVAFTVAGLAAMRADRRSSAAGPPRGARPERASGASAVP